ncbi:unnamed protein product, partial [Mesorhabditis spiculigera]
MTTTAQPDQSYYNRVLSYSRGQASKCGTLTVGAGVIASQILLAITAASAALLLDGMKLVKAKSAGSLHPAKVRVMNAYEGVRGTVERPLRFATEKSSDVLNAVLDVVSAILEKSLGLEIPSAQESSVLERVKAVIRGLYEFVTLKAHKQVIDPLSGQVQAAVEKFNKNLALVQVVREQGQWASDKMNEVKGSLGDLKNKFETEAANLQVDPEELLMKGIHRSNQELQQRLTVLREKGSQMMGQGSNFDGFITYLQELETSLAQADNIYSVQEEVLQEVRKRLNQLKPAGPWNNYFRNE